MSESIYYLLQFLQSFVVPLFGGSAQWRLAPLQSLVPNKQGHAQILEAREEKQSMCQEKNNKAKFKDFAQIFEFHKLISVKSI